jgi:hypothetical protein
VGAVAAGLCVDAAVALAAVGAVAADAGAVAAEVWTAAVGGEAGEVEVAAPQAVAVRQAAARSAWRIYVYLRTSPQQRF